MHRTMAAALDGAMIMAALGIFLLVFSLGGGEFVFNKQSVPLFVGIAAVIALFYFLLYCLSNGDTPGKHWTRLQTLNFEGNPPDREQRVYRLVGSCLSLFALGLGLIWALVDEENLTWHDHISKTFPTPRESAD